MKNFIKWLYEIFNQTNSDASVVDVTNTCKTCSFQSKKLEKIEEEVQARVDFKMNEFLTALKNTVNLYFNGIFNSGGSPKYFYYHEAFKIMEKMAIKEIEMPVPNNEMAMEIKRKKRNKAIIKLSERLLKRGDRDYFDKEQFIVGVVDELLNFE